MARVRALLTAFGPFLGRDQNQSQQVLEHCLRRLPEPWRAQLLPVNLPQLRNLVVPNTLLADLGIWLALGESGLEGPPVLETLAHNRYDFSADPASAGGVELCGLLEAVGPDRSAVLSPIAELAADLRQRGHALELSAEAGHHCCNALLYLATRSVAAAGDDRPWILFLHLPRRSTEIHAQARLVQDAMAWLAARRGH